MPKCPPARTESAQWFSDYEGRKYMIRSRGVYVCGVDGIEAEGETAEAAIERVRDKMDAT